MDDEERDAAASLILPNVFKYLKNARRLALDIGGSLAKVAYRSNVARKRVKVQQTEDPSEEAIYSVSEEEVECEVLHFVKFETKFIESCLSFIKSNLVSGEALLTGKTIKVTGGGAYKYRDLIMDTLGCQIDKEDEMDCLITGCNFLLRNIADEVFIYEKLSESSPGAAVGSSSSEFKFQGLATDIFPYLLVSIGSGVSFLWVKSETDFERVGGTAMGGGTFWGLGNLLTGGTKSFDELLSLAEKGDHRNVDMLVKDIYGGGYKALNLPEDLIASSLGKLFGKRSDGSFKPEDAVKSLLFVISNDIGQMAYLHAKTYNLKKIYFGGYFIRGHHFTMRTIAFAVNFWSQGEVQALFLRHEGYLGAIGAYLKGTSEEDVEQYSWGEDYSGSSALVSPRASLVPSSPFEALVISRLSGPLVSCPSLLDPTSYNPDTCNLTSDEEARTYWLQCFQDALDKFVERAMKSQPDQDDARERAERFGREFRDILENLKVNPSAYGTLTVRSLLDMREHCMRDADFDDIYLMQKQTENRQCLGELPQRLLVLSKLPEKERLLELARGLLAGNIFDWGAKAVTDVLETQEFGFDQAVGKLQTRPWLIDDLDRWTERMMTQPPPSCTAVFVDNCGADIILGVIPLVVELLSRGSKILLCANTKPALNDVTYSELKVILKQVEIISPVVAFAMETGGLRVMETGSGSPCLDLRNIDAQLSAAMTEQRIDFLVIVGMGRAIHTNFRAAFACEALKVAVIKNRWLAQSLGGDMFSVVFKFEPVNRVVSVGGNGSKDARDGKVRRGFR